MKIARNTLKFYEHDGGLFLSDHFRESGQQAFNNA
jgi:hypothetical protein